MQDFQQRRRRLARTVVLFRQGVGAEWFDTFIAATEDLTDEQFETGIAWCEANHDWLPTPALVRKNCGTLSAKARAWQTAANWQVKNAAARRGRTFEEERAARQRAEPMGRTLMQYLETKETHGEEQAVRELDDAQHELMRKLARGGMVRKVQ